MSDPLVKSVDALVVGAGMGGVVALHSLVVDRGMDAVVIDSAPGVGGTWFWNRYPGAMSDTESQLYRIPWHDDIFDLADWRSRYAQGPEILEYLNRVVDHWGLRSRIHLETAMTGAEFEDESGTWLVHTSRGHYRARFLVTAIGLLSAKNIPHFPGIQSFRGEIVHTAGYPTDLDITGKRVGVIGNGSTGVQFIIEAAKVAKTLTSFQRTPQYTVPAGDREYSEIELARIRADRWSMWDEFYNVKMGFGINETTRPTFSVSPEERQEIFEKAWAKGGGFAFMFETFGDITTDRAANAAAAEFIRSKIAKIVDDPKTAARLMPTEVHARRPVSDNGYYETFNRSNVKLVSLKDTPIATFTPEGVITEDGELHELDVMVMATGFDAVDGNYMCVDIRGRDGALLADHWANGPTSYLGVSVSGFPNMFMILGPASPFVNLAPAIALQARWIAEAIGHVAPTPGAWMDLDRSAEREWYERCVEAVNGSLFAEPASWIFGANIPDKRRSIYYYMGGMNEYWKLAEGEQKSGYPNYRIARGGAPTRPAEPTQRGPIKH